MDTKFIKDPLKTIAKSPVACKVSDKTIRLIGILIIGFKILNLSFTDENLTKFDSFYLNNFIRQFYYFILSKLDWK